MIILYKWFLVTNTNLLIIIYYLHKLVKRGDKE